MKYDNCSPQLRERSYSAVSVGCFLLATVSLTSCTSAPTQEDDAVSALSSVEPLLPKSSHALEPTADGFTLAAKNVRLSLPGSADGWVVGSATRKMRIANSLAAKAVQVNANTAVYVGTQPSTSSAVSLALRDDDSVVEFSTILHDRSAPSNHEIELALANGEHLVDDGGNRAHIEDSQGNVSALIEAPWAKDAAGVDVPFAMSVNENRVVLSVAHQDRAYAYPIVVDPAVTINCGIITCSIYYSRSWTKTISFYGWADGAVCALPVLTVPGQVICALSVAAFVGKASECASKNQCLRARYLINGDPAGLYCDSSKYCHDS